MQRTSLISSLIMHRAISHFEDNLARVRSLGGLFEALDGLTTQAVDATDVLRAEIVMAVSALDHYIHEITLRGMLEIYLGARPATPAYLRFEVPVSAAVPEVVTGGTEWFEAIIREKHGFLSFQQPDKVAAAIRLFSSCVLWPTVSDALGFPTNSVKNRLRLIVERRNKIAHEADLDPSYPSTRWPISLQDAVGVVDFIESICHRIHVAVV